MNTHDRDGRPWAKLSELKAGDKVETDNGFTCVSAGYSMLLENGKQLYFICAEGEHYITGQADDGEHCVGLYGPIR